MPWLGWALAQFLRKGAWAQILASLLAVVMVMLCRRIPPFERIISTDRRFLFFWQGCEYLFTMGSLRIRYLRSMAVGHNPGHLRVQESIHNSTHKNNNNECLDIKVDRPCKGEAKHYCVRC
jgi:hypothetical protein